MKFFQEKTKIEKNEIGIIIKSEKKLHQQFLTFWQNHQQLFQQSWLFQLDLEWRQRTCIRVRKTLLTISSGGFQSSILYCPELDPTSLSSSSSSSSPSSPSPSSSPDLLQLIDFVINSPILPDLIPGEVYEVDEEFLSYDSFLIRINHQLKESSEKAKMLTMIAVSRRHLLLIFCFMIVSELVGNGIRFVSDQIPGSQPKSSSSSSPPSSSPSPSSIDPEKVYDQPTIVSKVVDQQNPSVPSENGEQEKEQQKKVEGKVCSSVSCFSREEENGPKFKVCSLCKKIGKIVPYCSSQCQTNDWTAGHSDICGKHKLVPKK